MYSNSPRGSDLRAPLTAGRTVALHRARTVVHSADASPNSEIGRAHQRLLASNKATTDARDHLAACREHVRAADDKLAAAGDGDNLDVVARDLAAAHVARQEATRAAVALERAEQGQRDIREHVDSLLSEYTALSRSRADARHVEGRLIELGGEASA